MYTFSAVIMLALTTGFVSLVPAAAHSMEQDGRSKRAADVRNCDATPPYLPDTVTETLDRLTALRRVMAERANNVQAYLIPEEDAHQMEYLADHDRRRTYVSGFTGSAGLAVVTATMALLWTDGRYFLQAEKELDCNWQLMKVTGDPNGNALGAQAWLAENLQNGARVGLDPALISVSDFQGYEDTFAALVGKRITMVPITMNLVDQIWDTQPTYPNTTLLVLDAEKYTGETWQQKIWEFEGEDSLRGKMNASDAEAIVITKLDEIAWLFNLRGQDIPFNPMFVAYSIITMDNIRLYLYDRDGRLSEEVKTHLNIGNATCSTNETLAADCVGVLPYEQFLTDLESLRVTKKIWISDQSSYAVKSRVPELSALVKASPILLMKAVKSLKEREGMRNAHVKDSVALCELGGWLEETANSLQDPMVGDIDVLSELTVMEKATEFRRQQDLFQDLSFESISAFGPNGAVIHYRSTNETNRAITKDGMFLFDSGSQYLDGTTDITRTFHFGKPTRLMKEAYTRVLMGQIDVSNAVWPTGVYGRDLDAIARNPLWNAGLDYLHGTGHGIGHFLAVHEGPARLRIGYAEGQEPYEIGMFTSDEPGYYADGDFGVRIEDIVEVVEADTMYKFNNYTYMTFEMITMVPLEPNLIDFSLMSAKQIDHYNAYNARIRDVIGPRLSKRARKWMKSKTEPVSYEFTLNPKKTGPATGQATHMVAALLPMCLCYIMLNLLM